VTCSCGKEAEEGSDECFNCRVSTVGYSWHGGAMYGKSSWNKSRVEHMTEHFGTTDDRVMGREGIERA